MMPVTSELRRVLEEYRPIESDDVMETRVIGTIGYSRLTDCCDAIDAIHENLERECNRLFAEVQSLSSQLRKVADPDFIGGLQTELGDLRADYDELYERYELCWNDFNDLVDAEQDLYDLLRDARDEYADLERRHKNLGIGADIVAKRYFKLVETIDQIKVLVG